MDSNDAEQGTQHLLANHDLPVDASPRVRAIVEQMTLDEKLAQLVGFWVDQGDDVVAPMSGERVTSVTYQDATAHGLGQLTRVYGTRPVEPIERAAWLWQEQRRLRAASRFGIPALVHEECLTGLAAWQAATFPTPLAWGASFDPALVEHIGGLIGRSMRELGVHQGLAPVLDVIRDVRWGRVDECIAEDPYVVGTIGTAYVRGLQDAGVDATLKHFVGYSASKAGRNHAPTQIGTRELGDVFLPPFEMAVKAGARSVMNSYTEIDGEPVAGSRALLTDLLRGQWGFDGVVVSDYYAVAFLHAMHAVAADLGQAAERALDAGIDVELPTGDAYLGPLAERVRDGRTPLAIVDRALTRVLNQKERLGLLDDTFDQPPTAIDLDSPAHREAARQLAEESVVLLRNDGTLPLRPSTARLALLGPNADDSSALLGCYSFVNHVLAHHPGVEPGFALPTVADGLRAELPSTAIGVVAGCDVEGDDRSGLDGAVAEAAGADVAVVVVGDRAGLFGRGTVGEGNDSESLDLPGVQRELVERVRATGTPTVLVVISGRPYVLDWALDGDTPCAAVLQAFFPGEEGGPAIARIISGRVAPSGHLPVSLPRSAGAQPYSYLHPVLGGPSEVTSTDPTPVRPFGFGLTYTTFTRELIDVPATAPTDGALRFAVRVRNTGDRDGVDVVQVYARDRFARYTRPIAQLLAYQRVPIAAGEQVELRFDIPAARLAYTLTDGSRIVEPGTVELWVGPSCAERESETTVELVGPERRVHWHDRTLAEVDVVTAQPESVR